VNLVPSAYRNFYRDAKLVVNSLQNAAFWMFARRFHEPPKSALHVAPKHKEIDILHVSRALVTIETSPSVI